MMIYNTLLRVSASTLVDSLTTEWSFPSQALINESFSSEALSPTLNPSLSYWWTEREASAPSAEGGDSDNVMIQYWVSTLLWGEGCVLYVWLWFWYDEILIISLSVDLYWDYYTFGLSQCFHFFNQKYNSYAIHSENTTEIPPPALPYFPPAVKYLISTVHSRTSISI